MNKNILLCGVGGQGTVLASKLIAAAAMEKGLSVMSAETIGMAQKGGSVFSHLRVGSDIYSPMLAKGSADIIIAFEPAEAVRMLPYLKENGQLIVNSQSVIPVSAVLSGSGYNGTEMLDYLSETVDNLKVINCTEICTALGSPKVANMVMLGAAVKSGALDISLDEIKAAVRKKVKPQFIELNLKALDMA